MKKIIIRTAIALLTFLIGIGIFCWWIFTDIQVVPAPETYIGCNFENTADCLISETDRNFWEEEILFGFAEKPLPEFSGSFDESYRLVLLSTFDAPLAVRLWRKGGEYFIVTKKLSGRGGFGLKNFGELTYEKKRNLSEREWNRTLLLLEQTSFWRMSPRIKVPIMNDGAEWILEGSKEKDTHAVIRASPKKDFRKLCDHFLQLSGFTEEYKRY
jgi:hypothetical protein